MAPQAFPVAIRPDLTLSVAAQGNSSRPPLVLLPGPTDSWRSYLPLLDRLPPSVRAIAVSPRGHGESSKPATGYRVADFAADVVLLLDALGIERAVLGGHSGSCLVARRVAIDAPERVAGLVLESSPFTLRGDAGLEELVASVVSELEDPIDPAFARSFVIDTSSDDVEPAVVEAMAQELLKVPARVWREMFTGLLAYDDTSELDRITAPTLLIWGDADPLVDHAAQATLADRLSNATLTMHPGVGHTPRWEDPTQFATDVTTFLDDLHST